MGRRKRTETAPRRKRNQCRAVVVEEVQYGAPFRPCTATRWNDADYCGQHLGDKERQDVIRKCLANGWEKHMWQLSRTPHPALEGLPHATTGKPLEPSQPSRKELLSRAAPPPRPAPPKPEPAPPPPVEPEPTPFVSLVPEKQDAKSLLEDLLSS